MRTHQLFLALSCMLIHALVSHADVIGVPGEHPTIQGAIDASSDGDEIVVSPGTYFETVIFPFDRGITLRSTDPSDPDVVASTIIDGDGGGGIGQTGVLMDTGSFSAFRGFTVQNGNEGLSVGFNKGDNEYEISDCVFRNNSKMNGEVFSCFSADVTFTRCSFEGNSAGGQFGVMYLLIADVAFDTCEFRGNVGTGGFRGPVIVAQSRVDFMDCLFENNASNGEGGAVYVAGNTFGFETSFERCVFRGNTNTHPDGGGALFLQGSLVSVTDCEFLDNETSGAGGAIAIYEAEFVMSGCRFEGNTASENGGAIANISDTAVSDLFDITDAIFIGNGASGSGGAVHGKFASIARCRFEGNASEMDGGAFHGLVDRLLECEFIGNHADGDGGGVFADPEDVDQCLFASNSAGGRGGAIASEFVDFYTNCTITGNSASMGGGVYIFGSVFSLNSVIYANTPTDIDMSNQNAVNSYEHSIIGIATVGLFTSQVQRIDADPMFIDATIGDYRLSSGSPAIDAGVNEDVPPDLTTDLGGAPRFVDDPETNDTGVGTAPIVDIGAYEFQGVTVACPGDCDGSGEVGFDDLIAILFVFGQSDDASCDADGSGEVSFNDLIAALFRFGPCE